MPAGDDNARAEEERPIPQGGGALLFQRSIRLPHATAMVVGTIIGASIFVQPSEISLHVPSFPGTLAVWLLAGALTFCGAFVCAELASAMPRTGGVYVFLSESLSPALGFLWGWAMFWSMHSGIIAAICVIFARYVAWFVPMSDAGVRLVAIAAVLGLSAINYVGVSYGTIVQTTLTVVKVVAIALILLLVGAFGPAPDAIDTIATGAATSASSSASAAASSSPPVASSASSASSALSDPSRGPEVSGRSSGIVVPFILALSAGLFAFGGWHMVTYAAGETAQPARTIPRALLIGTAIVTVCYLALNAAYLYVLPIEALQQSTRVAADAAARAGGSWSAGAVSALVIVSSFGAASGIVLAGPRVYYAMARDGLLFRWVGAVHPRYRTPHVAIVLQAICVCALIAGDSYRGLFTRVIYTEWIFFGLLAAGLMRLRGRAAYQPVTRVWGYPFVPLIFVAASGLVVATHVIADPVQSLSGLLLVAAGLPVYWWWASDRRQGGAPHARD